ncbi:dioscorin dioA3-like [Dioscorea cayenensis subsp. rotundata]|uniref:Carbonic anhydrase n=1 Tax=Dioscorea cayennensis subsp. rotundata TaxID=55577 RepID=A0AB40CGA0_DIOCR|nr:dioscorin dioA3-like [Dioscorea cayenensis subsp. rotundata]
MKLFVFLFMMLFTQVLTQGEKPNFWLCPPAIWECVIGNLNYNYIEGDPKGPENWWKLHDNWALCGKGQMQSPIDLSDEEKDPTLGNLKLNYMATNATLVNHGREVVLEWDGDAGYLKIDSTQYSLKQMYWHYPSEHQIDSTRYDLEAHMVHESKDGKKAVIANLYKIGASNQFLEKVINSLIN